MEHGLFRDASIVNYHRHALLLYPENMPLEESIEREFLQAAVKRSQLLQAGEPRKANKEYDKIYILKGKLRQLPDRGEAALKRISTTEDPDVQITAAAALLALDEPFATTLLERIRNSNPGLPSFTAEMTLQEWNNGSIREYWS